MTFVELVVWAAAIGGVVAVAWYVISAQRDAKLTEAQQAYVVAISTQRAESYFHAVATAQAQAAADAAAAAVAAPASAPSAPEAPAPAPPPRPVAPAPVQQAAPVEPEQPREPEQPQGEEPQAIAPVAAAPVVVTPEPVLRCFESKLEASVPSPSSPETYPVEKIWTTAGRTRAASASKEELRSRNAIGLPRAFWAGLDAGAAWP